MTERPNRRVLLSGLARRDIEDVMEWTLQRFGESAALRYDALIKQALKDIGSDPCRAGSLPRPELLMKGARTYHLALSRNRGPGPRVRNPRHLLLYRVRDNGVVEVARVLHDARDCARHLPED